MIRVTLKRGIEYHIDDIDNESVSHYIWHIDDGGYPATHTSNGRAIRLHVFLKGKAPEDLTWDHIDRNKLNNHRDNIVAVTQGINNENRAARGNTGHKGIHLLSNGKYSVDVWVPKLNKTIYLGRTETFDEACKIRLEAIKKLQEDEIYGVQPRN